MDGAKEDLVDMFIVHTTEEIQVRLKLNLILRPIFSQIPEIGFCFKRRVIEKIRTASY